MAVYKPKKIWSVDVITKQLDDLNKIYQKNPTVENKKAWYKKLDEVLLFKNEIDPLPDWLELPSNKNKK